MLHTISFGQRYPCFGADTNMTPKEWWRECVYESFIQSGYDYHKDSAVFEKYLIEFMHCLIHENRYVF